MRVKIFTIISILFLGLTSVQAEEKDISISNEFQLNDKRVSNLYLAVLEVKRGSIGGESIRENIKNVSQKENSLDTILSNEKLDFDELIICKQANSIALLPGSRKSEISLLANDMIREARELKRKDKSYPPFL